MKITLRVFRIVVTKFECNYFDYTALYSAKVDSIDFESQNFVGKGTASGNTKTKVHRTW